MTLRLYTCLYTHLLYSVESRGLYALLGLGEWEIVLRLEDIHIDARDDLGSEVCGVTMRIGGACDV